MVFEITTMKPREKEIKEKRRGREGRKEEEEKKGKGGGGEGGAGVQGQLGQWGKGRIIFKFVSVQPNSFYQPYIHISHVSI